MVRVSPALWCATWLVVSFTAAVPASPTNQVASAPAPASSSATAPSAAVPAAAALTAKVKELWQKQHDLEYADPEIARIRKDMVELERQLVEKRKDLAQQLARKPEIKKLEQERLDLVRQLQGAGPAAAGQP